MKTKLTIVAKSDKHGGFCIAAIDGRGKFYRLVRDEQGHALTEEQCKFKKLDIIIADILPAPLKHQPENYVLNELLEVQSAVLSADKLRSLFRNPAQIFADEKPWLTENEIFQQRNSLVFAQVDNLHIYENDEEKIKADFWLGGVEHKGFSITDPEFKSKAKKINSAMALFSLPDIPYARYGHELYYKFICAINVGEKSLDCYRLQFRKRAA